MAEVSLSPIPLDKRLAKLVGWSVPLRNSRSVREGERTVQVDIEVIAVDDSGASASLFRWLKRDPDARRTVSASLSGEAPAGSMGSVEVINAVLSQATSLATLAVAIASWRDSRAGRPSIKATVGARSVALEGDPSEIALAISALSKGPDDDLPAAGSALDRGGSTGGTCEFA